METNQSQLQLNRPPHTEPGGKRVEGLGGWMILVQIFVLLNLTAVSIVLFREVLPYFGSENWGLLEDPILKSAIIFQSVASIIMFALLVLAVVLMYRKKKSFPKTMITLMILSFVVAAVVYGLVKQVEVLEGMKEKEFTKPIGQAIVLCCIGIPYFMRSKRVKNTFVN